MSEHVYFVTIGLVLGTVLLVFAIRAGAAVRQARAQHDHGEAYRQLAETAGAAQARTSASLTAIEAALAEVRTRLAAVEAVLKDV